MIQTLDGVTKTERILHRLCAGSFLRLWTYGNVYRDQTIGGGNRQGKEICDALVVFGDRVIVFSDKECYFSAHEDLQVRWERWYKRAIRKSQSQLLGAERWLRSHPERIFMDRACKERILALPSDWESVKIYKVVVANGISDAVRSHFNDSGSLMLRHEGYLAPSDSASSLSEPFTLKSSIADKDVFHVFDESNLSIILSTLDTLSDFVRYLDKREELFKSGKSFFASGEEELLAYYLQHIDTHGGHDFVFDQDYDGIWFCSGLWDEFVSGELMRSRQEANRQSYLWDHMIEALSHDLVEGALRYPVPEGRSRETKILEQLASENRFKRRILARMLLDVMSYPEIDHGFYARTLRPESIGDPYYFFLSMSRNATENEEDYRETRAKLLFGYCRAVRSHFDSANDVYGIATELNSSTTRSWDAYYYDGSDFSDQEAREAQAFSEESGVFRHLAPNQENFLEYPAEGLEKRSRLGPRRAKGRHRNRPCQCGSGRKYKYCCGRPRASSRLDWLTLGDE